MSLKFKDKFDFATFDNLMEEDANVVYEFSCLASNVKKIVVGVFDFVFCSLKNMKKNPIICFLRC